MPKKRGSQPGNVNAIKHGFYSRWFTQLELNDLENATVDHLVDAILLLKVVGRRVLDKAQEGEIDLKTWVQALETLGRTQVRIAALLRSSRLMAGKTDDAFHKQLLEAIEKAKRDTVY